MRHERRSSVASLVLLTFVSTLFSGHSLTCAESTAKSDEDEGAKKAIEQFLGGWKTEKGHMRPLDDSGWKLRLDAFRVLAGTHEQARPLLVEKLLHESPEVRAFAAQALGFVGSTKETSALRQLLEREENAVSRLYAVDALGKLGTFEEDELYARIRGDDPNRDVQAHVKFALERQGAALPADVRSQLARFDMTLADSARVDKKAPDFTLVDALGKTHRLSNFRGKAWVVLIFVYGDT